jgi:ribosome recycling factor
MVKEILKDAKRRMQSAVDILDEELKGIRTGRAHPGLVEHLEVEYYGVPTPLIQLASISVPEPRSLLIKPFDRSLLKAIERAIIASDLGLTPNNDGQNIRLNLPPLTTERRKDLVKLVHNRAEEAKVAVRNVRRDAMKDLKAAEDEKMISEDERKQGEKDLQKLTDEFVGKIEQLFKDKEQEIMEF